jgi:hypothetical protein
LENKKGKKMHSHKLYVPSEFALQYLELFARKFGGATEYPSTGAWIDQSGNLVVEPISVIESINDKVARNWLELIARKLCREAHQECVAIQIDGNLEFIRDGITIVKK